MDVIGDKILSKAPAFRAWNIHKVVHYWMLDVFIKINIMRQSSIPILQRNFDLNLTTNSTTGHNCTVGVKNNAPTRISMG